MNTERFTFGGVTLEVRGQHAWTVSKASARFHAEDGAETNHVISVEYSPTPPPVPDHAVKNGPVSRWREGEALHTLRVYGARQFSYAVRTQGQTRLVFGEGYRSTMYSQAILESADMFDILADYGQLVLHSSYVLPPNGKAVLFSGPSGIGKSTQAARRRAQARLWHFHTMQVVPASETLPQTACSIPARRAYAKTPQRLFGR